MEDLGEDFRALATRAHSGTSFVPERRAEQHAREVTEHLEETRAWIAKHAPADRVGAMFSEYRAGYLKHYRAWLAAKSRCISTMITGGSNFPVRRAEKANHSEHNHLQRLLAYDRRARRRIGREIEGANRPDDPAAAVRAEIAQRRATVEAMKACNRIVRKKGLTDEQKVEEMQKATGWSTGLLWKALTPDFAGRLGFPGYELTSQNGKIKRLEAKLRVLETVPAAEGQKGGKGWEIVEDARDDRLRIVFDDIPAPEVRAQLKHSGFHWSRMAGAWQRQLTQAARIDAARITGALS